MSESGAMAILEVVWVDSNSVHGWHRRADMLATVTEGAMVCRSVGYLFHEDATRIVLVGDQNDNDQVAEAMAIPLAAILSRRVLTP